mmetsp:Transcript_81553/g.212093  ORF Transcript_81553/g.212093 Transcript_81553/m.212093 type:complete len:208 (-) Transcript_81553:8-631(-)
MAADLELQNWHQAIGHGALAEPELLLNQGPDAICFRQLDGGACLRPEDTRRSCGLKQLPEAGDVLHKLDSTFFVCQAFVDLQERHDPLLLPQVSRGWQVADASVEGILKQDGGDDARAVEGRATEDAAAHLVCLVQHFRLPEVVADTDPVKPQHLRSTAQALVKSCDKAFLAAHLLQLLIPDRRSGHHHRLARALNKPGSVMSPNTS